MMIVTKATTHPAVMPAIMPVVMSSFETSFTSTLCVPFAVATDTVIKDDCVLAVVNEEDAKGVEGEEVAEDEEVTEDAEGEEGNEGEDDDDEVIYPELVLAMALGVVGVAGE